MSSTGRAARTRNTASTGLRWTEEHAADYGGDPGRVFMMGHSAGGHLVALAGADDGMDPGAVRGYIAMSAVWDLADMQATQDAARSARRETTTTPWCSSSARVTTT
jgi:acetyl esterase/lipase